MSATDIGPSARIPDRLESPNPTTRFGGSIMRVFVTGATGFIGSAVVAELIDAGHDVIGLARSDEAAAAVQAAGAKPHRCALDDLDSLHSRAAAADGVGHTAYIHHFSQMENAARTDLAA